MPLLHQVCEQSGPCAVVVIKLFKMLYVYLKSCLFIYALIFLIDILSPLFGTLVSSAQVSFLFAKLISLACFTSLILHFIIHACAMYLILNVFNC